MPTCVAAISSRFVAVCHFLRQRPQKGGPGGLETGLESGFSKRSESAFRRLERGPKNTIYSTTCGYRLCARRNASFMAQIDQSAPHFAQLIRDILEGFT
jgi:hypothetical protein